MKTTLRMLAACEFTGTVRDAFAARGWQAESCDLQPSETPGTHHQGDVLKLLAGAQFDLVIAFPPCTYLCSSGLHWNHRRPERAAQTAEALEFVRALMHYGESCRGFALENPTGCISTKIRKPDQIIQPYQFGHDASKGTCLWLRGLPPLKDGQHVRPRLVCRACGWTVSGKGERWEEAGAKGCLSCGAEPAKLAPRWANQTDSGQNKLAPSARRGMDRARTYSGIAAAFADQWTAHFENL